MDTGTFFHEINRYENIVVYGAGMVGSLVYKTLLHHGYDSDKIHFAISMTPGTDLYYGHIVEDIASVCSSLDDYIIVVSVLPKNQAQLVRCLDELHIEKRIIIDEKLFSEMEQTYVEAFNQEHEPIKKSYDILFMSSDSNISSGAVLCLVDINAELNRRGLSTLVILPEYGRAEELLTEKHLDFIYVLSDSWLVNSEDGIDKFSSHRNCMAVKRVKSLINKYRIRYVHNNSMFSFIGCVAARELDVPYIWHIREFIKEQGFWFSDEKYAFELINNSKYIITISDYVGKCYPQLDKKKVRRIYDGVDVDRFFKKHDLFTKRTLTLLMPGNIVPLKGQEQLVMAAALLAKKKVDFKIIFIGSGDANYIEKLIRLVRVSHLEEKITFRDRSRDIEKFYADADIVVVCSKSEAFGRVTVEAQLSGCIVIGADCGATSELIDNQVNGYLYPFNDVAKLADLIACVNNDKRRSSSVALHGQKDAIVKYSKNRNADAICKLYRGAIDG